MLLTSESLKKELGYGRLSRYIRRVVDWKGP